MGLDLEKYLNNGPLKIKTIREAKKRVLIDRMKFQQKTMANYRSVISRFNSPDCAFKFPIDRDKDNFPVWRNAVFQNLQQAFELQKNTSIHPIEILKQKELALIILSLNVSPIDQAYAYVLDNQPIDNYVALASLCGLIDHARAVYNDDKERVPRLDPLEHPILNYLNDSGKKMLPELIKRFHNNIKSKRGHTKKIAYLFMGLFQYQYTTGLPLQNVTEIHRNLKKSFGEIGTRSALSDQINGWRDSNDLAKEIQLMLLALAG